MAIKAKIYCDNIIIYPKTIRLERDGRVVLLKRTAEIMPVNLSAAQTKLVKKRQKINNMSIVAINAGVGKIQELLR